MHFTQLISEEYFTTGRAMVIVLPLMEEDSTNKEVGYLIEELHTSGRWSILVHNVRHKTSWNIYVEVHPYSSYTILMSRPCKKWEEYISHNLQQTYKIFLNEEGKHSWSPRATFVISVISNCTRTEIKKFSTAILIEFWLKEVVNTADLFVKPNKHNGKVL
jgi:hypothetical protein